MNIVIKAINLKLSQGSKEYILEKVGLLNKFLNFLDPKKKSSLEIMAEVGRETRHHQKGQIYFAQIQIHLPGKELTAKSEAEDLKLAVNSARCEIEQEIKRYKEKIGDIAKRRLRKIKDNFHLA